MRTLEGKIVLITGANGGLGQAVTRAFLDAGAKVGGAAQAIRDSDFSHPDFMALSGEVSTADAAAGVVRAVQARWGRIDALIHLIGGFVGGARVDETSDETFDNMLAINFRTAFYFIKAVLPAMREQKSGRIVAIGSRTAVVPTATLGAYSASKAALVSLVQTVALENKDRGITANVVLPGTMDTPVNRASMPASDPTRWVPPSQVAALLVHLASDASSNINGAVIPIFGGDL
jgi:NAD(P)-dependent dehydrogenase (short-subunit alcohol dehydrogenase family)